MIEGSGPDRARPGVIVSFLVAALFLGLAAWAAADAGVWALALLLLAGVWVGLGVRALRRARPDS